MEDPDFIVKGWIDELLAIRKIDQKHIVVVYKEVGNDGFASYEAQRAIAKAMCI